jgi:L-alanine-DL-glutamate epimerase-like enolase superfamily enzyme
MQITGVRTAWVNLPFETPLRSAIHYIPGIDCVLVTVDSDEGITGEGLLWTFGESRLPVLDAMVRNLAQRIVGRDPHEVSGLWRELWGEINFLGHKGVTIFALAALDMAMWDMVGKAHGEPVHRRLGKARDRVRAYHSGGLWITRSLDELVAEAKRFKAEGFTAMKMRFGLPRWQDDAERCAAVREAVGPEITLMADANQAFSVNHAIRLGRAIEQYDLAWFEEPVQAYDLAGSARVAAALDTPIASGETEYTRYGFRDMLERGSADVLMPDLQRVGGVTEFVKVAHMADAFDVPISPHVYTEQSLQLCAALSNIEITEYMPWFQPLYNEALEIEDGEILIPDRPGLGFTFNPDAVERLALKR